MAEPQTASETRRTASPLIFQIRGETPKTAGLVVISTLPSPLTRDHLTRARAQLSEALEAALAFRLQRPRLEARTTEGKLIRQTALIESPERGVYLAAEGEPGGPASSTDEWFLRVVTGFGRKRTL